MEMMSMRMIRIRISRAICSTTRGLMVRGFRACFASKLLTSVHGPERRRSPYSPRSSPSSHNLSHLSFTSKRTLGNRARLFWFQLVVGQVWLPLGLDTSAYALQHFPSQHGSGSRVLAFLACFLFTGVLVASLFLRSAGMDGCYLLDCFRWAVADLDSCSLESERERSRIVHSILDTFGVIHISFLLPFLGALLLTAPSSTPRPARNLRLWIYIQHRWKLLFSDGHLQRLARHFTSTTFGGGRLA